MKKNDKIFKNAVKKMNVGINHRSGSFSFNLFRLRVRLFFSELYYSFLKVFADKNFSDSFVLSFAVHFIVFLFLLVYPFIFFPSIHRDNFKRDDVVVFDLSDLKVGRENILPNIKIEKKVEFKKDVVQDSKPVNNLQKTEEKSVSKMESLSPLSPVPVAVLDDVKKSDTVLETDSDNKKDIAKDAEKTLQIDEKKTDDVVQNQNVNAPISDDENKVDEDVITGDVDDLLIDVKKGVKAEKLTVVDIPAGLKTDAPTTDNDRRALQVSYIDAIKFRVQNCWNIDVGVEGVRNMKVQITVNFLPSGYIKSTRITNAGDYVGSTSFKAVADSARRAIVLCAPYKFSVENYDYWKTVDFNFYPDRKNIE